MPILAIESAWRGCSVAVAEGETVLAYLREDEPNRQSARLVPMIEEAMRAAGLQFPQLSRIAATHGPGSFTGIRIGLATARALGFAAAVPVFGVSTLAAMAAGILSASSVNSGAPSLTLPPAGGGDKKVLALLDAGRGESYAQIFTADPFSAVGDAAIVSAAEAEALAGTCDLVTREAPDARAVAWLAAREEFWGAPDPLYIRPCAAKPVHPFMEV
jgi:tRNA threonylcarbamoyladenosine biosynthesis protein TsaB